MNRNPRRALSPSIHRNPSQNAHRRLASLAVAGVTIVAGLIWRLVPLGLPPFLYKYGGSALWAVMVYWLLAALLPRQPPLSLALIACTVAAAVEFSRLHHSPAEDAFRLTLAGRLLLSPSPRLAASSPIDTSGR